MTGHQSLGDSAGTLDGESPLFMTRLPGTAVQEHRAITHEPVPERGRIPPHGTGITLPPILHFPEIA